MRNGIFKSRIKKVRKLLAKRRVGALIVTCGANVSYLSGFTGEDSWLILTAKDTWLVTDSRFTLQAKRECRGCKIYERKGRMTEAAIDILRKASIGRAVAVEDKIELAVFNALRKKMGRLKTVSGLAESVRQVKDKFEIAAIKRAIKISEKALAKVLRKIRIGMSESEAAAMLNFEIQKAGASPAFETIVAFGSNSAMAHHRPTIRKLKKVDMILIDFGAKVQGYCSDMTRCFAAGRVNDFYARVYKTVFETQAAVIKAVKAGVKVKKIDAGAREIITAAKLPAYGHGLGHGVGLEVHEHPAVSVKSKAILQSGNVVTIEPAVYLGGKFGIRIEDDVLITERGCKVLTTLLKSDEVPVLKVK